MQRRLFAQFLFALGLMVLFNSSLYAATINVWSNAGAVNGDGKCSILEAVQAANTNLAVDNCPAGESSVTDTIKINYVGVIILSSTLIITEAVHIEGYGPNITNLSGNNQRQIMRIDMADMTDDFSAEKLSFVNARSTNTNLNLGGAVQLAQGRDFTFSAVTFGANATFEALGTAIFAGPLTGNDNGRLFISACDFVNNNSVSGDGSAIYSAYNTDVIDPQNNMNPLLTISIEDCEFSDNSSQFGNAAISAYGVKNVFVKGSLFKDNDAGGSAVLTVVGDGVHDRPMAIIENNTFMNNSADGLTAGVSIHDADALMTQNTFYNNVSQNQFDTGGALVVGGSAYAALYYNTFIENSAGGAYDGSINVLHSASLNMLGNIVYSASENDSDCRFSFQAVYQSLGANIDGDGSCGGHASDAVTTDPKLNPIGRFGGNGNTVLQYTMPPMSNSVAVDFGPVNNCTGAFGVSLLEDQRQKTKPVDGNGDLIIACDAGATEYQPGDDPQLPELAIDVTGSGNVVSDPAGISCSSSCSAMFELDDVVSLAASPEQDWQFSHWSGACTGEVSPCEVTMTGATSVTANFIEIPEEFELALTITGSGSVSIAELDASCSGRCSYDVVEGTVLTLTPNVPAGQDFEGFSGACSGHNPCQITMKASQSISATFIPQQRQLLVTAVGGGSVTSTPAGISCSGSCNAMFDFNQLVSLQAAAEAGWEFSHWSGVCSGSPTTCNVTMSSNKTTTAHFEQVSTDEVIFSASFED